MFIEKQFFEEELYDCARSGQLMSSVLIVNDCNWNAAHEGGTQTGVSLVEGKPKSASPEGGAKTGEKKCTHSQCSTHAAFRPPRRRTIRCSTPVPCTGSRSRYPRSQSAAPTISTHNIRVATPIARPSRT